jgi:ribosomal protein L23
MFGVFEKGYTSICYFKTKQEATDLCNQLNIKITRKKIKGQIKETVKVIYKYHVKEIKTL